MQWELAIPPRNIKPIRALARNLGLKLLHDPEEDSWILIGPHLPETLQKYAKKANSWILDVPFEHRYKASALGAKWDKKTKAWIFSGNSLPVELRPFQPLPYSWEEYKFFESQPKWTYREGNGSIRLRPHQIAARDAILAAKKASMSGFLLADDVGLGKTYSAWAAVLEQYRQARILVVSPVSVLPVWREAILSLGDGGNKVILLNYERLKKLFDLEEGQKVKSLKGLAKRGSVMNFDAVIWDESHYLKSMYGANAAARAKLAGKLYNASSFMIWLSATAGQNILELGYLKPLLLGNDRQTTLLDWCKHQGFKVTKGNYGRLNWEPSPDEEERLHKILFQSKPLTGLRRLPQEVAGWPEIQRILFPVELNPEQQKLYDLAWKEFVAALLLDRKAGKVSQNGLVAALRLRQKASLLKVSATVDLVDDLVRSNKRVPVSVEFLDSLKAIAEGLDKKKISYATITGSTADREVQRRRFQEGKCDVILFTVKEGISLHQGQLLGKKDKARAQVVHDLRWSGIDQHQIDGRSHRDGQYCPIYWMILKGTVEDKVAQRVLERMGGMAGIMGDVKDVLGKLMDDLG
jgi:SNF2 family DNA or RNA helicase